MNERLLVLSIHGGIRMPPGNNYFELFAAQAAL